MFSYRTIKLKMMTEIEIHDFTEPDNFNFLINKNLFIYFLINKNPIMAVNGI